LPLRDWNPLKIIAMGIMLILIGGVGLTILRLNLGLILFVGLGVYATLLGIHYLIERRKGT
jgi:hypothetical protein